jgi:transposase-like protein
MRYLGPEKLEIIRLVEQSHLPVRRTLAKIGIPPTTFYRWYDRLVEHGRDLDQTIASYWSTNCANRGSAEDTSSVHIGWIRHQ